MHSSSFTALDRLSGRMAANSSSASSSVGRNQRVAMPRSVTVRSTSPRKASSMPWCRTAAKARCARMANREYTP